MLDIIKPKRIPWNKGGKATAGSFKKGHKHSEKSIEKIKIARARQINERHPGWKGDSAGKSAMHKWIEKSLGKPNHCAHCHINNAKKFEWANISHSYRRILSDWVRLCTRCHRAFDMGRILLTDLIK